MNPDNSSPLNAFPLITLDEASNLYHVHLGELIRRGMALQVKQGVFPGCAPVGYLNRRKRGRAFFVINEQMAALVAEGFKLAAQNDMSDALSLSRICLLLNAKGLRSRNGHSIGAGALRHILTNPFYTGKIRFHGEVLPGNHQPLISQELFEEVQQKLAKRKPKAC
jgi:hypothetical protein